MGLGGVRKSRPFSLQEAVTQIFRRWYLVLLLGIAGSAAIYLLRDRFRPSFESEASFRVIRVVKAPVVDSEVQLPVEEPPEPAVLAANLLDEALTNESLESLFKAKPEVFADELEQGRQSYIDYLRKHAKLEPKTEKLYGVLARGRSPQQARELASWITEEAIRTYRQQQTERYRTLAKFTRRQADAASKKLTDHENGMVEFLRQYPDLLVGALDRDRRLTTAGPDRMRVQAVLQQAGRALSTKDPALRSLMEQRNRLRSELRSLANADEPSHSKGSVKLRELNQAKGRLNQLKAEGLADDHPLVKQARREVERLEKEVGKIEPGRETQSSAYSARVRRKLREIDRKLSKRLKRQRSSPRLEAKWGEMVREQQLLLGQFSSLDRLASSASFSNRLGDSEAKHLANLVEPASTPGSPTGVKPKMVLAGGCALSFLLGLGIALLFGRLDRKLYHPHEVEPLLGNPLLAVLERQRQSMDKLDPASQRLIAWSDREDEVEVGVRLPEEGEGPAQRDRDQDALIDDGGLLALPPARGDDSDALVPQTSGAVVLDNLLEEDRAVSLRIRSVIASAPSAPGLFLATEPRGPGADQMRLLASRLEEVDEHPCRVVVVTSWEPRVGRTTLAANLALAMAESRRRTLLVDTCGGDATLTRLFGLRPGEVPSLYEQLSSQMAGSMEPWTLYKVAEALSVIPAGAEAHPMAPMLSTLAFGELVDQLKLIFDVLIFDSVALSEVADAVVLQQHADAVVALVARKRSTLSGFAELTRQIDPHRLRGVVFNRK
jgi:Mrp family chromosome partitioning ATPase/uncharacterized protein involved in exopolysaccharide biosynthesis